MPLESCLYLAVELTVTTSVVEVIVHSPVMILIFACTF